MGEHDGSIDSRLKRVESLLALALARSAKAFVPPDASSVTYSPATPADWDGTVPTEVAEALDLLAVGARAYTPTAEGVVIPAGTSPGVAGLAVMVAVFTPRANGKTLCVVNLDLELNQADTVGAGLWSSGPVVSIANNTAIQAADGVSQPIYKAASPAGITVNPVLNAGSLVCRNQQNIATAPFQGNASLSGALQLAVGVETFVGVFLSSGLNTTTISGRCSMWLYEMPLR